MKSAPYFFIYLLLLLHAHPFHSQTKSPVFLTKKFSPLQLKADAELLKNVTLTMHPGVGIFKPKSYYEALFNNLIVELKDSLNEKEFRIKTKLVLNQVNCGHTDIGYSKKTIREIGRMSFNYSPVIFYAVGNKVYSAGSIYKKRDSIISRATEITKINGIGVDSMIRFSSRFLSHDGFVESSSAQFLQSYFNNYMLGLFGRPDTFHVEIVKDGVVQNVSYKSVKLKKPPVLHTGSKKDSLFVRYKKAGMKYRFLNENKETLILDIDKFSHKKYPKAYRRVFRKLAKNKTKNFVIDLRDNGGGSLSNSYTFLTYLVDTVCNQTLVTGIKKYPYGKHTKGNFWFRFTKFVFRVIGKRTVSNDTSYFLYRIKPRKKHHYNNRIFVLINGGSFSASCLVSAYLKSRKNVSFVGSETGGTYEGCNAGIMPYYTLPNTGLRVRMPAFRVNNDVCKKITGHGIIPEYPINYTIDDLLNKRDLELKKVEELIKN